MLAANAAQMRECDRVTIEDLGMPGVALMELAGRGATSALLEAMAARGLAAPGARVDVFCGGGNNGGDGFVIARQLLCEGCHVEVFLLSGRERYEGDAALNLAYLERVLVEDLVVGQGHIAALGDQLDEGADVGDLLSRIGPRDVVVDALLGTGLSSEVRSPYAEVIAHINASPALIFAVDIPSGLSSDDGHPLGAAVAADVTATFALPKVGHALYPGRALSGHLVVVDIGIPPGVYARAGVDTILLEMTDAGHMLPARPVTAHKGTFGHVLMVGGQTGKGGALAMAASSAIRSGAGLVTAGGSINTLPVVTGLQPEVMTTPVFDRHDDVHVSLEDIASLLDDKTVLAAGPGLGTTGAAKNALKELLDAAEVPIVLDADALNIVASWPDPAAELRRFTEDQPVVLTPHPGEFSRLTGLETPDILGDPLAAARRFAAESDAFVVLKGAATVIAAPGGAAAINTSGNSGMASAGMGDVLTGIIAGLLAQGLDGWDAACLGVFVHGLSGDIASDQVGSRTLVATDLIDALGEAFQRCETA